MDYFISESGHCIGACCLYRPFAFKRFAKQFETLSVGKRRWAKRANLRNEGDVWYETGLVR